MKKEGGLWIYGRRKPEKIDVPKITVITIAFNGGEFLEQTLLSTFNQTYENVEVLVIDGGSSDKSLEILQKYNNQIDYWVSENDKGIYHAMNKGIGLSTGDWISFMNCGDRFFSNSVLAQVFENLVSSESKIIFGNWEVRYPSGRSKIRNAGFEFDLWKGSQFCHQAAIIQGDYHRSHLYSLDMPIVADFDFFYRAQQSNVEFQKLDLVLASIESAGISDIERIKSIQGWRSIVVKTWKSDLFFLRRLIREKVVLRLKKLIK